MILSDLGCWELQKPFSWKDFVDADISSPMYIHPFIQNKYSNESLITINNIFETNWLVAIYEPSMKKN